MKLRNQYQDLKGQIEDRFNALRKAHSFVQILPDDEVVESSALFTIVNRSGEDVDVVLIQLDPQGLLVANDDDRERQYYIGFNDLSSVEDRLGVIEVIEATLDIES